MCSVGVWHFMRVTLVYSDTGWFLVQQKLIIIHCYLNSVWRAWSTLPISSRTSSTHLATSWSCHHCSRFTATIFPTTWSPQVLSFLWSSCTSCTGNPSCSKCLALLQTHWRQGAPHSVTHSNYSPQVSLSLLKKFKNQMRLRSVPTSAQFGDQVQRPVACVGVGQNEEASHLPGLLLHWRVRHNNCARVHLNLLHGGRLWCRDHPSKWDADKYAWF